MVSPMSLLRLPPVSCVTRLNILEDKMWINIFVYVVVVDADGNTIQNC